MLLCNKNRSKIFTLSFIIWIGIFNLDAQDSIQKTNITIIGLKSHYGWALIHSSKLKPLKGATPWGIELDISKHFINQKSWDYCNCYPRLGFSFYYWSLGNTALGNAYNGMFYIEPFFSYSNKINLSMRGGFGFAYLTNPYHEINNPDNLAYSTNISFPLLLNLSLNYDINPNLNIVLSANYQHISNGGVKQPNLGINYPTFNLGVDYTLNPFRFPKREKTKFKDFQEKNNRWKLSLSSAYKDVESTDTTSKPVIGINIYYSKQVANLSALALGLCFESDYGAKYVIDNYSDTFYDHKRVSVFIGHEFLLGRFVFYQFLGAYFYRPYQFADPTYQRYGLSFYITKKIYAGFSLKAHRHVAEYLDLRIGISY